MKFTVKDQSHPSLEFLIEAGATLAIFMGLIAGRKIYDWLQRRKDGKKTPVEHIKENIARSERELKTIVDTQWDIPNSTTTHEKFVGAHHAADYNTFENALTAIKTVIPNLSLDGDMKQKIASSISKLKDRVPVYKDDNDASMIVEFPDSGIVWPNDMFYRDLDGCNKKFVDLASVVLKSLKTVSDTCEKTLDSVKESDDESTLSNVATLINAVNVVSYLVLGTIVGYIDNLYTIEEETEYVK